MYNCNEPYSSAGNKTEALKELTLDRMNFRASIFSAAHKVFPALLLFRHKMSFFWSVVLLYWSILNWTCRSEGSFFGSFSGNISLYFRNIFLTEEHVLNMLFFSAGCKKTANNWSPFSCYAAIVFSVKIENCSGWKPSMVDHFFRFLTVVLFVFISLFLGSLFQFNPMMMSGFNGYTANKFFHISLYL